MKKILITGSNGQLGSELKDWASAYPQFKCTFTDIHTLNICDANYLDDFFKMQQPHFCINAAAYTAVDAAESDKFKSYDINVAGVSHLAKACKKHNCRFIHVSTDFVFGGEQNKPYTEDSPTNPLGVYGASKRLGEMEALLHNPETLVIRTAWLYSSFGKNFVKTMLKLGKERSELGVVFDQISNPTYAQDLAKAILDIVSFLNDESIVNENIWGVYHYANEGAVSWYDFAAAIFDIADISVKLYPIRTEDYPTVADRPAYSVFDKSKIKKTFALHIPHWRKSLKKCLKRLEAI